MFAKEIELNLVGDLTENAVVELNAADVDDVSGGVWPIVAWIVAHKVGVSITGAAVAGVGTGVGLAWLNRK